MLREAGARTVADLGCGEGTLTGDLLNDSGFTQVIAADVSARALAQAARRLRLDRMPDARRERLTMFQTSLTYRDARLAGLDAAVLMEVIEHVEPDRLSAVERAVFGFAAPRTVVVTTPNREYNPEYGMADGRLRHRDHRFEWDRAEFTAWASRVGAAYGYGVRFAEPARSRRRPGRRRSWRCSPAPRLPSPGAAARAAARDSGVPREQGAFHPRAVARGARRGERRRQVHVRPRPLQADRGDLL